MNNFEKSPSEKPERLSEEDARKEADMLRESIGISPITGKIDVPVYEELGDEKFEYRKATSKDYEVAFNELEELKNLAEKYPELLIKLLQYTQISILGVAMPFLILRDYFNFDDNSTVPSIETVNFVRKMKDSIFSDARSKLEKLQEKGEKFGQYEKEAEKYRRN